MHGILMSAVIHHFGVDGEQMKLLHGRKLLPTTTRRKKHEKSCISTFNSRNNLFDGYAFCRINAGWILRRMIMTNREAIELVKEAARYADVRWMPCRERMFEASSRYLLLIKNDYERRYSKTAERDND